MPIVPAGNPAADGSKNQETGRTATRRPGQRRGRYATDFSQASNVFKASERSSRCG